MNRLYEYAYKSGGSAEWIIQISSPDMTNDSDEFSEIAYHLLKQASSIVHGMNNSPIAISKVNYSGGN